MKLSVPSKFCSTRFADQLRWRIPEEAKSIARYGEAGMAGIELKNTVNIVVSDFIAAIRGECLNPDSCKFTISGIFSSLSPSETEVESGFGVEPPSFNDETLLAPRKRYCKIVLLEQCLMKMSYVINLQHK